MRSATEATTREEWGTRFEKMKADRRVPTPAEAAQLTTEELRRRATKQQIPGRSTMTRDDVNAAVIVILSGGPQARPALQGHECEVPRNEGC